MLVTLFLVACTRSTPNATHSPTPTPSPGNIAWTDCGGGFQCGTLQVPLEYSHPEARKIALALIRIQAKNHATRIGSLLVNPGGPGASGIEYLRADLSSLRNLNQRFDLVAWDPRSPDAPAFVAQGVAVRQWDFAFAGAGRSFAFARVGAQSELVVIE